MSQAVIFRNRGIIDPRSITTFGTSSKESDNAIGFFGTGLKYAIAVLLRLGCNITIYSGGKQYGFATKAAKIRVDQFDIVTMNNRALGFTTELGKTWEAWMAFRELYCNTMDEGGEVLTTSTPELYVQGSIPYQLELTQPSAKDQTIVVVRGQPILDAWADRDKVILSTPPAVSLPNLNIHPGPSRFVYYRGVRVHELREPSLFTYNIQARIDLTEDRTAKYSWDISHQVAKGCAAADVPEVLHQVLTADKGAFEHNLDFSGQVPSDNFMRTVGRLTREHSRFLNRSAVDLVRVLNSSYLVDDDAVLKLTPVEAIMLQRAVAFCHSLGYPVDSYPIVPVEFLGEEVLGRADVSRQRILLARRSFQIGTKNVAGTLLEEYLHLKHKLADESRSMQNFLLDALVSLGERLNGEPL